MSLALHRTRPATFDLVQRLSHCRLVLMLECLPQGCLPTGDLARLVGDEDGERVESQRGPGEATW